MIDGLRKDAFSLPSSPPDELTSGTVIGDRYLLKEVLGSGAMGTVYRALDNRLHNRTVAVKFLKKGLPKAESFKRRFELESLAAANIKHPNVCDIYDKGMFNDIPYLVLEYIEGHSLETALSEGVTIRQFLGMALQISEGMKAIHAEEIIHRDIKPSNVMVTSSGTVKIMDFGIVKLQGLSQNTLDGHTVGTVPYMSPEQIYNKNVDVRSDIWSLWCRNVRNAHRPASVLMEVYQKF